jgi:hypothetical protein
MREYSEQFHIGDCVVVKTPGLTIWGQVIGLVAGKEAGLRIECFNNAEVVVVDAKQCRRLKRSVTTRGVGRGSRYALND